ncbi:PHP domain-containing protein [Paracandidimonas soli]|uniref:Polymerase/histidinol phosphatase N-terminal domain-containing protein n=1 Tax=Paracandidimonas soli TaxID=1917182 RepID=A0A4R3UNS9_9BURK|nr:PHP domain-containing protein [Paracandidimonas soli]TCU92612.1 hypothetical protein EV686_11450 [Paracandidimonas soli]
MDAATWKVDLHSHSLVSDGMLTPGQVAQRAHDNGVRMWALTDHDELSGLPAAREVAESLGMRFIDGVEISVTWCRRTVHIVGLNVDPNNLLLSDGLAWIRQGRVERARQMGDQLAALGMPGSYEGALRYAANPYLLSRTHFARYLADQGYCATVQEVFDRWLADDKPGNVPMQWSTLEQAVSWIVGAGGKAIIAHPGRYKYSDIQFDALFDEFRQLGGVGVEVNTGSHTPAQYVEYAQVARRYGFQASCGSDFHGVSESRLDLGDLPPLPKDLVPVWQDWV